MEVRTRISEYVAMRKAATEPTERLAVPTFIRERRRLKGWSQERLAEEVGVSTATISNLETGRNGFTDKTLVLIAKGLGCSPEEVLIDPNASNSPIRDLHEIEATLRRIVGLSDQDRLVALTVIKNALRARSA